MQNIIITRSCILKLFQLKLKLELTEYKLESNFSESSPDIVQGLLDQLEDAQMVLCTGISEENAVQTNLVKTVRVYLTTLLGTVSVPLISLLVNTTQ